MHRMLTNMVEGPEGFQPKRLTRGKCLICNLVYRWIAPPLLRESACPKCGQRLERISFVWHDGVYGPPAGYRLAEGPPN